MNREELLKVQKALQATRSSLFEWSQELGKDLQRNDTQAPIEQKRLEDTLYESLPLIQSDLNKCKKSLSRFGKLYRFENPT